MAFNAARIDLEAADNRATLGVNYEGSDLLDKGSELNLSALLSRDDKGKPAIDLSTLQSFLRIKEDVWELHESEIQCSNGEIKVDGFRLASENQSISLDGGVSPFRKDSLKILIHNLNLDILNDFLSEKTPSVGGIIDGFPAGVRIDEAKVHRLLARRRPSQEFETTRCEPDKVRFLSGIKDGVTLGTPITFVIENQKHNSAEYDELIEVFRPSHADYTYQAKYGIRDHRGGGRASARETVARVAAGALAMQFLEQQGISIDACVAQIGNVKLSDTQSLDFQTAEQSPLRCPDKETESEMQRLIAETQGKGDTLGGVIACVISGCKAGLGEPVFDKLSADLAKAMMGIPSAKGFEIGEGFASAAMTGSAYADLFNPDFTTKTNHSGGIQGGISNGMDIVFSVAFHPVVTTAMPMECVDKKGNKQIIAAGGRHDCCQVPRAVPIVQSMAALVIMDNFLLQKTQN
ncbi:MAG: chorismate synthase [Bacteroidales bacterium]|nr:chorismate synthase [Bacteroidales bacterium]